VSLGWFEQVAVRQGKVLTGGIAWFALWPPLLTFLPEFHSRRQSRLLETVKLFYTAVMSVSSPVNNDSICSVNPPKFRS
jgi:hypothetical protein